MAQKGIREFDGKKVLFEWLNETKRAEMLVLVTPETNEKNLLRKNPWLKKTKLVAKPDQLFGKRGKHGLLSVGKNWKQTWSWIKSKMNKTVTVGETRGKLTHFLIEPFTPHKNSEEMYVALRSFREYDVIYFSEKGGIFVEENWDKVLETQVPVLKNIKDVKLNLPQLGNRKKQTESFIGKLHLLFREGGFTYLEINPFTFSDSDIVPLDLVAKIDDTSMHETSHIWGDIEFPASFGSHLTKEEKFIKELDEKSGSSLKLTVLNPEGRVWSMVAGGGASVIYADTICDLGFSKELANYGEYSGNPTTDETYQYAKTILDLMTRKKNPKGKFLLIGGGIANFTDVAKTFTGIIKALTEYREKIKNHKIKIFVRRGGPNYRQGLEKMRKFGLEMKLPIEVYGPETHMTRIVTMSLRGQSPKQSI